MKNLLSGSSFLFLTVFICLPNQAQAQIVKGKITFSDHTEEVSIDIPAKPFSIEPNFESLQFKVKYYDKDGKVVKLKPDDAREISFTLFNREIRMFSVYNTLGQRLFSNSTHIFLELIIDGPVKLFNYYYTERMSAVPGAGGMTIPGSSYAKEVLILQKEGGALVRPGAINFRKNMVTYFEMP